MDLAKISRMALEYSDAKDTGAYIRQIWNQLTVEESRALFREIDRRRDEFSDFCR